jgi:hypothetical protein
MAKRPTISTIATGYYSREALNNNFQNIQEAFDNTLSLDGSTPNAMSGDLDMNGNALLNIGTLDADSFTLNGTAINNPASVLSWEGSWTTATAYAAYDVVSQNGSSYICLVAHTSGTFATDLAANNWALLASVGASGAGSGDLVAANNLSDVANTTTSRTNLGAQAQSNILDDLSGLTQATNKIPYFDSATTASVLDFKDEDDMVSDSATAVPSQQSVKAYVDAELASVGGGIGTGQTWQNVLVSRANSTQYQNTSGKPIMVSVASNSVSGGTSITAYAGVTSANVEVARGGGYYTQPSCQFIVPDQHYYKVVGGNGLAFWAELR